MAYYLPKIVLLGHCCTTKASHFRGCLQFPETTPFSPTNATFVIMPKAEEDLGIYDGVVRSCSGHRAWTIVWGCFLEER